MRVPLEGGQPEAVQASDVRGMYGMGAGEALSPDGKRLAFVADINSIPVVSKLGLVTSLELAVRPHLASTRSTDSDGRWDWFHQRDELHS